MVPRTGMPLIGLACLVSAACGGELDLVAASTAEDEPDASGQFRDVMTTEPCEPGVYRGSFQANQGFGLKGQITVTMSRSSSGEFFTVGRNSTLETPALDTGATVKATVVGDGSCTTGDFVARLEEGQYQLPGAEQPAIPFTGEVNGTYRFTQRGPALLGKWKAFLPASPPEQPISAGIWMAVLGTEPSSE